MLYCQFSFIQFPFWNGHWQSPCPTNWPESHSRGPRGSSLRSRAVPCPSSSNYEDWPLDFPKEAVGSDRWKPVDVRCEMHRNAMYLVQWCTLMYTVQRPKVRNFLNAESQGQTALWLSVALLCVWSCANYTAVGRVAHAIEWAEQWPLIFVTIQESICTKPSNPFMSEDSGVVIIPW